jgi:hypothetical protein
MRNRASIRRRRRETTNDTRNLVHDADNTTSMLVIQDLVEKARHAAEEVQRGIIRAGLQRHLYPFEPRPASSLLREIPAAACLPAFNRSSPPRPFPPLCLHCA